MTLKQLQWQTTPSLSRLILAYQAMQYSSVPQKFKTLPVLWVYNWKTSSVLPYPLHWVGHELHIRLHAHTPCSLPFPFSRGSWGCNEWISFLYKLVSSRIQPHPYCSPRPVFYTVLLKVSGSSENYFPIASNMNVQSWISSQNGELLPAGLESQQLTTKSSFGFVLSERLFTCSNPPALTSSSVLFWLVPALHWRHMGGSG